MITSEEMNEAGARMREAVKAKLEQVSAATGRAIGLICLDLRLSGKFYANLCEGKPARMKPETYERVMGEMNAMLGVGE